MAVQLDLNNAALTDLLHGLDGPVAAYLNELAVQATGYAKALAPVQGPRQYSWSLKGSTSYFPWEGGFTKAGVHAHAAAYDSRGQLFSGVNAPYAPTIWLQSGRSHTRRVEPFMTTALFAISIG